MNNLKDKYLKEVKAKLAEELGVANTMAVPKLTKIVVNVGVGEAKDNKAILDGVVANMAALSGQKPVVTQAKKSISAFKLVKGQPIGVMATLRGEKMYAFLEKLVNVVLPKVRDFRGVPDSSFDNRGNYNLGLREQLLFPEVDYKSADKSRGLQITITSSAWDKVSGKRLLELLGMPFSKPDERRAS